MSVLIKGMAMPYGCANCSYMGGAVYDSKGMAHYSCNVDVEGIRGTDVTNEVVAMYEGAEESFPDFCPLIEVKEPHGSLVDFDQMVEDYWDGAVMVINEQKFKQIESSIIIEAEGSEE